MLNPALTKGFIKGRGNAQHFFNIKTKKAPSNIKQRLVNTCFEKFTFTEEHEFKKKMRMSKYKICSGL